MLLDGRGGTFKLVPHQLKTPMEIQGTVYDILRDKSGSVWTADPAESVYEAIRRMGEKGIGALVVVQNGEVIGVLSERDYSR